YLHAPQVRPTWDRRLGVTVRVLSAVAEALGANPIRAGSIVDQAQHPTTAPGVERRLEGGLRFLDHGAAQRRLHAPRSGVLARDAERDPIGKGYATLFTQPVGSFAHRPGC